VGNTSWKGRLLVATPVLDDPNFARTVVVLLEHTEGDGALGVVLNRPTETSVSEVLPFLTPLIGEPPVVFEGGPVHPTAAVGLARPRRGVETDAVAQLWPLLATVDLEREPSELAEAVTALRVFAGYAGWGAGQLEAEVAEGAWYVVDALPDDPFLPDAHRLWELVLRRQGGPLAMVATFPPDPRLN
jgi:putative transcriptional regulator